MKPRSRQKVRLCAPYGCYLKNVGGAYYGRRIWSKALIEG